TGLTITKDLAIAIDLGLGAAIAAPVVAAGVAGTGATGALASGMTIAGTGLAVGGEGAILGGGLTAIGGGSWEDVKSDAWKWGKRGVAVGLGGGATQVAGAALGVGTTGLSTASSVARTTAAQTIGTVVTNVSGTALEGGSLKDMAKSGGIGLATGLV